MNRDDRYIVGHANVIRTVIYFITDGSAIKVGLAKCVTSRMMTLQIGNPRPLTLISTIPGDRKLELRLKRKWVDKRIQGEWFRDDPDIRYFAAHGAHRPDANKRRKPPAKSTSTFRTPQHAPSPINDLACD